ncbi:hypothetical protein SAMN05880501_101151 [Ureibacillus xyleni]|uniref:Uncharacterized protein n=1 Tax=Ureibacillus xyleni TaxID=614648 RepID=A0A285R9E1_9BACL|nr:hypothetical protein [Ureibacillus xyleni]SOB90378.1 hypothetical protein SAMN05880501_101151 [Ureibacillus xyleni]
MGELYVIEDYLFNKLEQLKKEEQLLYSFIEKGNDELIGELLSVVEEIVSISCQLDHIGTESNTIGVRGEMSR